jgi:hypothetical protein
MKKLLLLPILLLTLTIGFSQVEAEPAYVEGSGDVVEVADIGTEFHVINNNENTLDLLWKIREIDAPDNWNFYLCDTNLCYGPGEADCNPEKPNVVEPDSSSLMQFHVLVAGTQGVGTYEIDYFDKSAPQEILVTVPVTITAISTSTKEVRIEDVKVYPNPVTSYFSITENDLISKILIYNVVGKQVKAFDANSNGTYSIASLNEGMYLVRLIDQQGKVAKVLRISKR